MTDPIWTTGEIRMLLVWIGALVVVTLIAALFGERLLGMDKEDD